MAVSTDFLDAWIAEHGPWLYHLAHSATTRDRILGEGLLPAGLRGERSSYANEAVAARPGHVYLCTEEGLPLIADQSFGNWSDLRRRERILSETVAIDARGLNSVALSPDEDCCFVSFLSGSRLGGHLPPPNAADPELTVRERYLASVKRESEETYESRPYHSFGDWAEAEGVGDDPEHTAKCWMTFGSLAHRGPIAPTLVRPADPAKFLSEGTSSRPCARAWNK